MEMKDKLKSFLYQFLIIIFYFFIIYGTMTILLTITKHRNNLINFLILFTTYLIALTSFIFIFRKTIVPDFYDFKKNFRKYLTDNFQYYVIGLAFMILASNIIFSFMGLPQNEISNREALVASPIISVFSSIIFAPIVEELMTRVILKDTFKHKWIYVLLSGFIFGLLHVIFNLQNNLGELLYIVIYGSLGSAFAVAYLKSNNVWTNISFHFLHNAICIIILLI